MAGKKYAKDYRLTDSLDERGRIRTETEYIGAYYRFAGAADAVRKAQGRLLATALLGALSFLLSLLPRSTASLTLYVMLPFLFTALPIGLLLEALLHLRRSGERLDRRSADQANVRVPGCCLWFVILPGAALLGEGIALTLGHGAFLPGDGLFLAGALCTALCGWICFREKDALHCVPESAE